MYRRYARYVGGRFPRHTGGHVVPKQPQCNSFASAIVFPPACASPPAVGRRGGSHTAAVASAIMFPPASVLAPAVGRRGVNHTGA
eukprot:scaffold231669_cov21-Tisochrysis_lutea.AAC.1